MSATRKAHTVMVTVLEPEEVSRNARTLGQLRVTARGQEETWALDLDNRDNVRSTILSAVHEAVDAIWDEDLER